MQLVLKPIKNELICQIDTYKYVTCEVEKVFVLLTHNIDCALALCREALKMSKKNRRLWFYHQNKLKKIRPLTMR